ncbi:hypothetical protein HHS34_005330 [Acidithiobacillus montserratensis]|uniref:Uncharacterized protein n=1 Tax=Acidithiobacillus montserratensis TaxID=2729135 RepID=A0ACD5HIA4_9PROT|nr:hypothetical protein [Acidithiobacillus montserratensis]MBU2746588.1 hypothetical protein [Acidithiobacillus montserratensis]
MSDLKPSYRYIEQIRSGQPQKDIFLGFASHAGDALDWVSEQKERKQSFFRLIEGEFGFGKTTFARILCDRDISPVKGFITSLGIRSTFKEKFVISDWLFRAEPTPLFQEMVLSVKQGGIPSLASLDPSWYPLVLAVLGVVNGRYQSNVIQSLLQRWIVEDRVQDLKVLLSGNAGMPVAIPLLSERIMEGFFDVAATLLAGTGSFPVLILDEAESIALLHNTNSGKDRAAQRIREWMDYLMNRTGDPVGFFGLITHEGMDTMYRYGALGDRVASPKDFFLAEHVLWRMNRLGAWNDIPAIIEFLIGCYCAEDATSVGRKTGEALRQISPEAYEKSVACLKDFGFSPRQKLKMVVCDILDRYQSPEIIQEWLEKNRKPTQEETPEDALPVPLVIDEDSADEWMWEEDLTEKEIPTQADGAMNIADDEDARVYAALRAIVPDCDWDAESLSDADVSRENEDSEESQALVAEVLQPMECAVDTEDSEEFPAIDNSEAEIEYCENNMQLMDEELFNPLTHAPFFIPAAAQTFSFEKPAKNCQLKREYVPVNSSGQGAWFGSMLCWYPARRIAPLIPVHSVGTRMSPENAVAFLRQWMGNLLFAAAIFCHDSQGTYPGFCSNNELDYSVIKNWEEIPKEKMRAKMPVKFSTLRCLAWSILFQITNLQEIKNWQDLQATVDNLLLDRFGLRSEIRKMPRTGLLIQESGGGLSFFFSQPRIADMDISWNSVRYCKD